MIMEERNHLLGDLLPADFLKNYWQKKPLLIRQAIPNFQLPLTPEELAGLSCEEDVESRIVIEKDGDHPWQLLYGPFDDQTFAKMPETHWTLLVQETNKHLPEMAELMDRFDFIPSWRVDDVMISYAPDQGTVGPHLDNYDVFLLQGAGKRRWQISDSPMPEHEMDLIPDIELGILNEFSADNDWILEPGDMLYLPPRFVHHGVAQGDCMTLSIGFRSQSHAELINSYMEHVVKNLEEDFRYGDPDLELQKHPGEITGSRLRSIKKVLQQHITFDEQQLAQWFGCSVTEATSSYDDPLDREPAYSGKKFEKLFQSEGILNRYPRCRFAFYREEQELQLFVDGEALHLSSDMFEVATLLCDERDYVYEDFQPLLKQSGVLELLTDLFNAGYIITDNEF